MVYGHYRTWQEVNEMVSQEDMNKAVKSAKASATRAANKTKAPTRKKGRKYYRPVKLKTQVNNAIGRFQRKHPYIAPAAMILGGVAATDGALQHLGKSNQAFLFEAGVTPATLYKNKLYKVPYQFGRSISKLLRGLF